MTPKIKIEYDGEYPCLCMGHLILWIDDVKWDFGKFCLSSGGRVTGGPPDWDFEIEKGPWEVSEWPEGFPEDEYLRLNVLEEINSNIPYGCCGGCI